MPTSTVNTRPKESREQRQQRIESELIVEGMKLFCEKGFEHTTIPEIADAVGISKRTFFRYFEAKEDLVFHWLDELGNLASEVLQQCPANQHPSISMQQGYTAIASYLEAQGQGLLKQTQLIFREPSLRKRYLEENNKWEERFADIIRHTLDPNGLDELTLQVHIATVTTSFVVAIRHWSMSNDASPLTHWTARAFAALNRP